MPYEYRSTSSKIFSTNVEAYVVSSTKWFSIGFNLVSSNAIDMDVFMLAKWADMLFSTSLLYLFASVVVNILGAGNFVDRFVQQQKIGKYDGPHLITLTCHNAALDSESPRNHPAETCGCSVALCPSTPNRHRSTRIGASSVHLIRCVCIAKCFNLIRCGNM